VALTTYKTVSRTLIYYWELETWNEERKTRNWETGIWKPGYTAVIRVETSKWRTIGEEGDLRYLLQTPSTVSKVPSRILESSVHQVIFALTCTAGSIFGEVKKR